ncbi:hypothetical protein AZF37_09015 [endosymbiont 'TC1' of Trimyema compressum]|nr:hypothetical protein AZF37_00900 [endosymbiont 'TC1' of Trimyema compressum]AMP21263.1 hypothetical protein AZF37_09015 [endosymbiont 'TC1' of Trimyema compressum]
MTDMNLPKMPTIKLRFIHPRSIPNFDCPNYLNMDLFSRKIIAWKLSLKIDTSLVKDTFIKAFYSQKPSTSLIFHSDRGS